VSWLIRAALLPMGIWVGWGGSGSPSLPVFHDTASDF
jgi:hypothetical protein